MNLLKQQQIKKPSDRQQLRRGHRAYAVPEVVSRGPLVWLGDEDPCKICDAMDGKVDGEGWSSLRGPQWWVNTLGRWESLGKGRISGVPPVHPNCQCRLVSMREWLDVRRAELGQAGEFTVEVESVEYFKSQRESILKEVRAQRQMAQLMEKERREREREEKKKAEARAKEREKEVSGWTKAISFALDFIPPVAVARGVIELVSGKDLITGEKVGRLESGIALAVGIITIPGARRMGKFLGRSMGKVGGELLQGAHKAKSAGRRASQSLSKAKLVKGRKLQERSMRKDKGAKPREHDAKIDFWMEHLNLSVEETMKSHVLRHHVGKSDKYLLSRLENGKKDFSSTFRNYKEAENSVRRVLQENKNAIKKWAKDTSPHVNKAYTKEYFYKFESSAGRGIDSAGNKIENLREVTVIVHRKERNLRIITAYPAK